MKTKIFFLSLLVLLSFSASEVSGAVDDKNLESIEPFRLYKDIGKISVVVPTVIEVPFTEEFIERLDFAVFNETTKVFEPYFLKQQISVNKIPVAMSRADNGLNSAGFMNDEDVDTYTDFILPENANGNTQIFIMSQKPITSSSITVLLDKNVALPNYVELRALVDGQSRIVVAKKRMNDHTVSFPKTTSTAWTVSFNFSQPLRISELRLNQDNATLNNSMAVRFLAQPQQSYKIYFNPDRYSKVYVGESGNLSGAKDVRVIRNLPSLNNLDYKMSDIDSDGIKDINDNCVSVSNEDQLDVDGNGRGDVCDDFDQDGIVNSKDNCPNNPNVNQRDTDSDKIGDVCDDEESRITEKYGWIPWVGMGLAGIVLLGLFISVAKSIKPNVNKQEIVEQKPPEEIK